MKSYRSAARTLMAVILFGSTSGAAAPAQEEPQVGDRQVVMETTEGKIVLEVFPAAAPRHVSRFLERVDNKFYLGTAFHRVVPFGIIQGGDPLSREPEKFEQYGTGGLFELEREPSSVSHLRGTVSTVLAPGQPDSGGSQFFICVSDQTQLDGQYTAFARVVDGLDVVEQISQLPADSNQRLTQRVEVTATYQRDRPPPEVIPFADTPVEELFQYTVIVETNLGEMEVGFFPEEAPEHVRQFLRLAELGLYEGTTFHRVIPSFVIQGGSLSTRKVPVPPKSLKYVRRLKAEFNEHKHVRGVISMARAEHVDSAVDSFFIVLLPNPSLDGKYTVFGEVLRGMEVVDGIAQVPVRGETPIVPVEILSVRVRRSGSFQ